MVIFFVLMHEFVQFSRRSIEFTRICSIFFYLFVFRIKGLKCGEFVLCSAKMFLFLNRRTHYILGFLPSEFQVKKCRKSENNCFMKISWTVVAYEMKFDTKVCIRMLHIYMPSFKFLTQIVRYQITKICGKHFWQNFFFLFLIK